ncbi:MAG: Cys-tRNA(Pro) deacylase [Candidatus Cryptobacteroides sp.]|nr:Cys-tRNA(Pro) deacylase [Rikenellaceae bacterium]MDY5746993.1 Cys-tRNA(Pro) deacylase [Candidatus Cryptobacteroides sp.]
MMAEKTNAARLLEAAGIKFELIPYEYSEDDLSAQSVAAELGEDIDRVFKTLVLRGDRNGIFVCVIPGNFEVDLKLAAKISGNKSCEMVHVRELLGLTGYIRGGCSPIGMKKAYPTFIHESALLYDYIYISAGQRGLQFKLDPQDLIAYTSAGIYPL